MRTWIGRSLTLVLAVTMTACGHTSTAPSLPPPASAAGVWLGTLGIGSTEGQPLGILWDATETGNTVSGTARFYAGPLSTDQLLFVGAISGTRTGNQLSLTYTATQGTVPAGSCALEGIGMATINDGTLTGTLSLNVGTCEGFQPPTSMALQLSKQ
ncbi:MAG TPA: hypothetical protein VJN96_21760 [Vicinamibacterales bacterium]|nr:hypothetical protein [Vicinamibacterales bacterium]